MSDPLNLRDAICGVSQERKILVQSLEMINGRVAMLATVGFALQEAYTGTYVRAYAHTYVFLILKYSYVSLLILSCTQLIRKYASYYISFLLFTYY